MMQGIYDVTIVEQGVRCLFFAIGEDQTDNTKGYQKYTGITWIRVTPIQTLTVLKIAWLQ